MPSEIVAAVIAGAVAGKRVAHWGTCDLKVAVSGSVVEVAVHRRGEVINRFKVEVTEL